MAALVTDRRLAFNADRTRLLEMDDPKAAYLAYPEGASISDGDVRAYGLSMKDEKIVLPPASKAVPAAEAKMVEEPAEKAEAPEWTLAMSPAAYLERYGKDGPNSKLARAVIAAAKG